MNATVSELQRGKGKGRDHWVIRGFLLSRKHTMADVARAAKVAPQVAQETIRGTRNHKRVLAVLKSLGCPEELLFPSQFTKQGKAA